ncbi:YHS domain-containing protein [candidate division WOR-3 bacterium]|uniref:YHS domain-containing protein n=1 Tax=candidate division WOR-3 bacterium TaxID=2052148 RepID=A0A937XI25_UNCW3|nr:YHS domain-containing protein [candidate division WOR-3 bacterium]
MSHDHAKEEGNLDPVCGMTVTKEEAACSYDHKGKTYYFCAESCKDDFAASPDKYLRP